MIPIDYCTTTTTSVLIHLEHFIKQQKLLTENSLQVKVSRGDSFDDVQWGSGGTDETFYVCLLISQSTQSISPDIKSKNTV